MNDSELKELEIYYSDILHTLKSKEITYYKCYLKARKNIEDTYKETGSWDKVITTAVTCDEQDKNEAFVDVIETHYKTKVKNAEHLQELTGITEETLEGLQECINLQREAKFYDVIRIDLINGAKYKDLLKYEAKDFGLPDSWNSYKKIMNRDELIKQAIFLEFLTFDAEILNFNANVSLYSIAEELEVPYTFILEAKNYYNPYFEKRKNINGNHKD